MRNYKARLGQETDKVVGKAKNMVEKARQIVRPNSAPKLGSADFAVNKRRGGK